MTTGLCAEYESETRLEEAVRHVAEGGGDMDVFTPYPVPDLEPLLGIRRSTIPRWTLLGGLFGAASAYLLQLYTAAVSYPLDVGGRPLHSAPAFIPITFESGILAAALTTFCAVLIKGRLGRLYDPVFEIEGFERTTTDRFWLSVTNLDPVRAEALTAELLQSGALRVVPVRNT